MPLLLTNQDRKTWDYHKSLETAVPRSYLWCTLFSRKHPFLLLKLEKGQSLQQFFAVNFAVPDARRNREQTGDGGKLFGKRTLIFRELQTPAWSMP